MMQLLGLLLVVVGVSAIINQPTSPTTKLASPLDINPPSSSDTSSLVTKSQSARASPGEPREPRHLLGALAAGLQGLQHSLRGGREEKEEDMEKKDERKHDSKTETGVVHHHFHHGSSDSAVQKAGWTVEPVRAELLPSCRTEFVLVESVHYTDVVTKECSLTNHTQCRVEPYQDCKEKVEQECRAGERERCWKALEEECETRHRAEHSTTSHRDCSGAAGCRDLTRSTVARVPFLHCRLVSRPRCRAVQVRECRPVRATECTQRQKEVCQTVPRTECRDLTARHPVQLQHRKPVTVCSPGPPQQPAAVLDL